MCSRLRRISRLSGGGGLLSFTVSPTLLLVVLLSAATLACVQPYTEPLYAEGTVLIPISLEADAPALPMAAESSVRVHVYDSGSDCSDEVPGADSSLGVVTLRRRSTPREIRVAAGHSIYLSFRLQSEREGGVRRHCDKSGWLDLRDVGTESRYRIRYILRDGSRCEVEVTDETRRRTMPLLKRCR
jgi:hypothetical protein